MKLFIRLIYLPDTKNFELTIAEKRWKIKAAEVTAMIDDARKQLVNATDAMTEFSLIVPKSRLILKDVNSRNGLAAIINYLDKVWLSFQASPFAKDV